MAETGEQLIEVVTQAGDGVGIVRVEGIGEAAGGGLDFVEDAFDPVGPAALHRDAGKDLRQRRGQAVAAIDADHVEAPAFASDRLLADGTPIPVLDPGRGPNQDRAALDLCP